MVSTKRKQKITLTFNRDELPKEYVWLFNDIANVNDIDARGLPSPITGATRGRLMAMAIEKLAIDQLGYQAAERSLRMARAAIAFKERETSLPREENLKIWCNECEEEFFLITPK